MHEMSLCESILLILEEEAERQAFHKVRQITLDIGALSSVEPEAMTFCLSAITPGTLAEGAEVIITRSPGTAWCLECSQTIEIADRLDPCPLCGSHRRHGHDD